MMTCLLPTSYHSVKNMKNVVSPEQRIILSDGWNDFEDICKKSTKKIAKSRSSSKTLSAINSCNQTEGLFIRFITYSKAKQGSH